jgi:hypothetical protein
MSRFDNQDGTLLTLAVLTALGLGAEVSRRRRGSRQVPIKQLSDDQIAMLDALERAGPHEWDEIQTRLRLDGIDPNDYGDIEIYKQIGRRKEATLNAMFGGDVGLNADWSLSAWHLGPSDSPNSTTGDYYILEYEHDDDSWGIVRRWYVGISPAQDALAAQAYGDPQEFDAYNDYVEEIASFDSFKALLEHLGQNMRTYKPHGGIRG